MYFKNLKYKGCLRSQKGMTRVAKIGGPESQTRGIHSRGGSTGAVPFPGKSWTITDDINRVKCKTSWFRAHEIFSFISISSFFKINKKVCVTHWYKIYFQVILTITSTARTNSKKFGCFSSSFSNRIIGLKKRKMCLKMREKFLKINYTYIKKYKYGIRLFPMAHPFSFQLKKKWIDTRGLSIREEDYKRYGDQSFQFYFIGPLHTTWFWY